MALLSLLRHNWQTDNNLSLFLRLAGVTWPGWDVSDRYFAAEEMRMQKFKSTSGNSLVTHGQHKGRTGLCANAGLLAALLQAAADSRHFK